MLVWRQFGASFLSLLLIRKNEHRQAFVHNTKICIPVFFSNTHYLKMMMQDRIKIYRYTHENININL